MHIITAIIRTLHALEKDLELTQNTLVRKLTVRVHNMCSSTDTKHTTLMRFNHQSIVRLFENMTTLNKKGQKQSPIVDATDVQKLMLSLPYLLDGLADEELAVFNAGPGRVRGNALADPIPAAIMAVNEWLHWYKLYRKEAPDEDDVKRLTQMGTSLLRTKGVSIYCQSWIRTKQCPLNVGQRKGSFHSACSPQHLYDGQGQEHQLPGD